MTKNETPRCPKVERIRKMSGAGGMPSTWFVEHKCRLDVGHGGLCDFSRGARIRSAKPAPTAEQIQATYEEAMGRS